jgi:hypothetical protein
MTYEQIMEIWMMLIITAFVVTLAVGIFTLIKSDKR